MNTKLLENDSTLTDQNFLEYVSMLTNLGFEKVLEVPFSCKKEGTMLPNEMFYVFFSKDGMILCCETYRNGRLLHDAMIYYSHPNTDTISQNAWAHGSNDFHHTTKNICIGSNDARHKICRLVNELRKCYTLMSKWVNQGGFGIWFLHHGDIEDKNYDYKSINSNRWEQLPLEVKNAIPKMEY
jgi:hypothetical protein